MHEAVRQELAQRSIEDVAAFLDECKQLVEEGADAELFSLAYKTIHALPAYGTGWRVVSW